MRKLHIAIRNPNNGNSHRIDADGEFIDEMEVLFKKALDKEMLAVFWTDDDVFYFHMIIAQTDAMYEFERKFCCMED